MSFELVLLRFEAGHPVRIERAALQPALMRHGVDPEAGIYVQTRDGLDFELTIALGAAGSDPDQVVLAMRGISAGVLELVYDLAVAGELTLVLDDDSGALVTGAGRVAELPEELATQARVCRSAEEMATTILPVFERWRAWA